MNDLPLLILGFNRPSNTIKLFDRLRFSKPKLILFAVDGPREHVPSDIEKNLLVKSSIDHINWDAQILTRFRETNLGIRKAIPDAVNWAISEFGKVIVLEDDVLPGPQFLEYMKYSLEIFNEDNTIGHVSGYNCVPVNFISSHSSSRLSIYPSSYAWATWDRAWKNYKDDVSDFNDVIDSMDFDFASKMAWKINFEIARKDLVSTWAYRWLASLWRAKLTCISPNRNLVDYIGQEFGTHTFRKPRWTEVPISDLSFLNKGNNPTKDAFSEKWMGRVVYKESVIGLLDSALSFVALYLLKNINMYIKKIKNFAIKCVRYLDDKLIR